MSILAVERVRRLVYLASLALLLSGCATASGLQPATGDSRSFVVEGKTYDEIWTAARKAVLRHLTAIVESDKVRGRLTAEQKAGLFTWGEVVGVFITPADMPSPRYTVEVVSQKRLRGQVSGQDWTPTILEAIKTELGF